MYHSIRWRIAIPYAGLILATLLGLGMYISSFVKQTYLKNLESELTSQAFMAADALPLQLAGNIDSTTLDSTAKRWAQLLGARVTIIAADGTVVGESHEDRIRMENHANRPEVIIAQKNGVGSSTRYSESTGYDMMYTAARVTANDQVVGYARVALPVRSVEENVSHLQRVLGGVTLGATIIGILMALLIAQQTTRPLRQLTQAVTQLASGEIMRESPGETIVPTTFDEVGRLTHSYNRMATRLRTQIQALETERSKMAAVLAQMTDGVLIVSETGDVMLINPAAEEIFDVRQGEAIGHSLVSVLRHHQVVELWKQCQETGEIQSITLEMNPRRLYLQCVATPLGAALPGSILLLIQNLTRVRQLETVRRDFISNISHELRTPLASLKALTETLQESALDDPPAAKRFLQRMETEVDSLSLMVSELLELSRIESGRVPLQLRPTSPAELLTLATDRLRLQAERAGLEMTVDCTPDLPLVLCDPARMEQVLVNLLHNAIKFTPEGGKILVKAVEQKDENQVLFSVQDTGIGIPSAVIHRIFERFFKTDRARSSGGTGLGLAISRHLVEAHGGKIWAESQEGLGSTFYFSLPLAR